MSLFTITFKSLVAEFESETEADAKKGKESFLQFMGLGEKTIPGCVKKPSFNEIKQELPEDIELDIKTEPYGLEPFAELDIEQEIQSQSNEAPDFSDYIDSDTDVSEKF